MALRLREVSPGIPDIFEVLRFLGSEPVMLNALQEYIAQRDQRENALRTRLEEAERRLEELKGQSAEYEMEEERDDEDEELVEESASQEPVFNVEEAEWAPLPESDDDEAGNWLAEAELAPLPEDDEEENVEKPEAPMERGVAVEPERAFRELVLRSRTIKVPVLATQQMVVAAEPEEFHPADVGKLPEQLRKELQVPQTELYTIVREEGHVNIVCGICSRQFNSVKGWRIHASKLHKKDGFCTRCGHYLLTPPGYTAAQKSAAVEIHVLDWCPRASAAVLHERQVKRRRLELVGRIDSSLFL